MRIKYILLVYKHFLVLIYSLKIDHVGAKFIRDLNFKLKLINKIIILLSSTLVRKTTIP
jgi:hypothetical protein